ncbi:hypothetical protein HYH03_007313 [Edaphochlamys debaryana]|uniref:Uncharacterized protein n=1 Tax=Edaphochlamys debaryana TaxID=47281 RepID=A0A836BZ92_9CHLO|nr:hypothetical protein HYH03_007313 [Edaphochlamys debaryana]|eukprot:KAG2494546.1 hypothetical protein HYH03_007313 [Edaphochlamys debaryana]
MAVTLVKATELLIEQALKDVVDISVTTSKSGVEELKALHANSDAAVGLQTQLVAQQSDMIGKLIAHNEATRATLMDMHVATKDAFRSTQTAVVRTMELCINNMHRTLALQAAVTLVEKSPIEYQVVFPKPAKKPSTLDPSLQAFKTMFKEMGEALHIKDSKYALPENAVVIDDTSYRLPATPELSTELIKVILTDSLRGTSTLLPSNAVALDASQAGAPPEKQYSQAAFNVKLVAHLHGLTGIRPDLALAGEGKFSLSFPSGLSLFGPAHMPAPPPAPAAAPSPAPEAPASAASGELQEKPAAAEPAAVAAAAAEPADAAVAAPAPAAK